jgi:hypothetical protein
MNQNPPAAKDILSESDGSCVKKLGKRAVNEIEREDFLFSPLAARSEESH